MDAFCGKEMCTKQYSCTMTSWYATRREVAKDAKTSNRHDGETTTHKSPNAKHCWR